MTDDRWITLYDKNKNPKLGVRLTEEGYEKYQAGEKWDNNWIEIMMDIERIKLAEF